MAVSNFVLIHLIDVEIFYKVSKIFVLLVTLGKVRIIEASSSSWHHEWLL